MTVLKFLLRASLKRKFVVLITESFPNTTSHSHSFSKRLAKAGIESVIIPDTNVYAVMSRVGKVIIGVRTVLNNGSCVSSAGVASVCECAQQYRTPVLAVTGLYKLSPRYPFDIESLIEVGDTGKVSNFTDCVTVDAVEVINPLYDYIPPNHIDICVTNLYVIITGHCFFYAVTNFYFNLGEGFRPVLCIAWFWTTIALWMLIYNPPKPRLMIIYSFF